MEGEEVPTYFSVSSGRVAHYSDVVETMVQHAIDKCVAAGWRPSMEEITFFRKEVIRYAVIRHDLDGAMKLEIKRKQILKG